MRCKACDDRLTPREATRKCVGTGEYPDLCDTCMDTIRDDVELMDNPYFSVKEEDEGDSEQVSSLPTDYDQA